MIAYGNQLIVGVLDFAPPFVSKISNGNHYTGFCIDLMDQICKRLDESCQYKSTSLDGQINDLRQGIIDITFLPSPITTTDDKDYLYSLPYIPSTGQFITLQKTNLQSLSELRNKKVGIIQAAAFNKSILTQYTSLNNIHEYSKFPDLIDALTAHQVDAILLNSSVAKYVINNMENFHMLGAPIQLGMGYGMIALKKNAKIIDQINNTLLQMEADGTYVAIYNKYFGS